MKQRFLLSLVFVCTFMAATRAQIGKGSVWLGGGIGFNQSKSKSENSPDQKVETLNITPAAGKAIKENLIAGIRVGYMKNTNKNTTPNGSYTSNSKTKSYSAGVFIRQYVPVANRLYIFGEASAQYSRSKETRTELYNTINTSSQSKSWSTGLSFTPGISYGITKKLQLETGFNSLFGISYAKGIKRLNSEPYKESYKSFSTGINLENTSTFYLGFRVLINNQG